MMPTAEPHPLLGATEWIMTDEMRAEIEPHLRHGLPYAPAWLQSLTIRYDPTEEHLCRVHVAPEYRHAGIKVGSAWFSEGHKERRIAITHEILHSHTDSLACVFNDLLEALAPSEELKKWANEQWRRAEEGMVCDLSRRLADA